MEDRAAYAGGAAFVDGRFEPVAAARVPILDWGFLRSDATYDVAHVWRGSFFRLEDHLDRFERGMARLRMSLPYDRSEIRDILIECVRLSGLRGDRLHPRRPAARLARPARVREQLLRLRRALRLDRRPREAAAGAPRHDRPCAAYRARVGGPDRQELPLAGSGARPLRGLRPRRGDRDPGRPRRQRRRGAGLQRLRREGREDRYAVP